MEASRYRLYSIGRAVENKRLTDDQGKPSDKLMVIPLEQRTMADGELKSNPLSPEATGVDGQGNSYTTTVTMDGAVEATWYPQASNRQTPPDIRRGERVILWQYGDTNSFYWTETGWDDHLRKLETVRYTWSGTADEAVDGTQPGNCYFLEVSTHEKAITLGTSKANGEQFAYVVQINAKTGALVFADDAGNNIHIDSVESLVQMTNAMGTTWNLSKYTIYGHADDSITLDAGNQILMKTRTMVAQCTDYKVKSNTNLFDTPNTTFTGNVSMNGSMTAAKACTFSGPVTFKEAVTANGITSSAPIRGPSGTI